MLKHPRLVSFCLVSCLCASVACSRSKAPDQVVEDETASTGARGNAASIDRVKAAAHALAQPQATVDYVAAQMEGAVIARTKSQALIHYDGYRATLTTPADRVTRITFVLTEAKPSMKQLTKVFGSPRENPKGLLYQYEFTPTDSTIEILAEPVSMPADEDSLVGRIVIEGARTR